MKLAKVVRHRTVEVELVITRADHVGHRRSD
eukprot:COSAG06_NODE_43575_length_370_cov_3.309963_1_plen_30_part_01